MNCFLLLLNELHRNLFETLDTQDGTNDVHPKSILKVKVQAFFSVSNKQMFFKKSKNIFSVLNIINGLPTPVDTQKSVDRMILISLHFYRNKIQ